MSAYLNALREEGTREDLLKEIERHLAEKAELERQIEQLRKALTERNAQLGHVSKANQGAPWI